MRLSCALAQALRYMRRWPRGQSWPPRRHLLSVIIGMLLIAIVVLMATVSLRDISIARWRPASRKSHQSKRQPQNIIFGNAGVLS